MSLIVFFLVIKEVVLSNKYDGRQKKCLMDICGIHKALVILVPQQSPGFV
ncbi:hypothetical protein UFO1_0031 [Pelosinus sp. UFO1]|nr:hypothetical protein UFO1_0031 [Pelosinus sp. UFO1]